MQNLVVDVIWWVPAGIAFVGILFGVLLHMIYDRARGSAAVHQAKVIQEQAQRDAGNVAREAEILARNEIMKAREVFEHEMQTRRKEIAVTEERLMQREINLDRRVGVVDRKEQTLDEKMDNVEQQQSALKNAEVEAQKLNAALQTRLEERATLPREEARRLLLQQMEEELRGETNQIIRRSQQEAHATAVAEARTIILQAIERYAAPVVNEAAVCSVTLPGEEMKGRIIGREGRNIRTIEQVCGVQIIIDDTPGVVQVSSFDPIRREVARQTLEQLVADGRIQPARIEEISTKVRTELDDIMLKAAEQAVTELGLQPVVPEITRLLGRLKFRQSYAQNVLAHSVETARLMGLMAPDLGLDPALAKRVGLFHDIGKALDHEVEGNHAVIGADFLKRHGEAAVVYSAVAAHHHETEGDNLYSALASAADAITAARPGARAENTELFIQRLAELEALAMRQPGVEKAFAFQAGREIRVFVEPRMVDDAAALKLARELTRQIEYELKYPGQIRVVVVRETRFVEYAH
ncbi:MAG: ribonuclease Y [Verrucomicrobia bacterium]|nr:MAG: ribonuclease Y [Verrucomicrobiota bacterium]